MVNLNTFFTKMGEADSITMIANADLSAAANQYKYVNLRADGKIELCDAITEHPFGVLLNLPKADEEALIQVGGIGPVQANVALNENDLVSTSTDGQAQVATTTQKAVGKVIKPAGAAGEYAIVQHNFTHINAVL